MAAKQHDALLDALGDRTRRGILELLRSGPRPVVEIARELPVGRPAVSQHLKVLKDAGLVTDQPAGTRRVYQINPEGLAELEVYAAVVVVSGPDPLPTVRSTGCRQRHDVGAVMSTPGHPQASATGPLVVRQSVHVALAPSDAFRLFTDGIGEWWPLEEGFSYGGDRAHDIFLEPVEGGGFYERFVDGDELQVGTVVVCAPPDRVVFTWRSPEWPAETEVEVRFLADQSGTNVELAHRGWERLGADAENLSRTWANGWPRVVACFARNAHG